MPFKNIELSHWYGVTLSTFYCPLKRPLKNSSPCGNVSGRFRSGLQADPHNKENLYFMIIFNIIFYNMR